MLYILDLWHISVIGHKFCDSVYIIYLAKTMINSSIFKCILIMQIQLVETYNSHYKTYLDFIEKKTVKNLDGKHTYMQ